MVRFRRRMRFRHAPYHSASLLLLLILLTACSPGERTEHSPTSVSENSGVTTITSPSASTVQVLSSVSSKPEGGVSGDPMSETPIQGWSDLDLLGVVAFLLGVADRDAAITAYSTNVPEEEVARCMAERGFPYVQEESPAQLADQDPRYTMPALEYAEQYGLGITVLGLDRLPSVPLPASEIYMSGLGDAEEQAYRSALSTCKGNNPERNRVSNALTTAVAVFQPIMMTDPKVLEATDAWSNCMKSLGYSYDSPESMSSAFFRLLGENSDSGVLEAQLAEEIRVALADVECRPPYVDVYRAVMAERLPEFEAILGAALDEATSAQG